MRTNEGDNKYFTFQETIHRHIRVKRALHRNIHLKLIHLSAANPQVRGETYDLSFFFFTDPGYRHIIIPSTWGEHRGQSGEGRDDRSSERPEEAITKTKWINWTESLKAVTQFSLGQIIGRIIPLRIKAEGTISSQRADDIFLCTFLDKGNGISQAW